MKRTSAPNSAGWSSDMIAVNIILLTLIICAVIALVRILTGTASWQRRGRRRSYD